MKTTVINSDYGKSIQICNSISKIVSDYRGSASKIDLSFDIAKVEHISVPYSVKFSTFQKTFQSIVDFPFYLPFVLFSLY